MKHPSEKRRIRPAFLAIAGCALAALLVPWMLRPLSPPGGDNAEPATTPEQAVATEATPVPDEGVAGPQVFAGYQAASGGAGQVATAQGTTAASAGTSPGPAGAVAPVAGIKSEAEYKRRVAEASERAYSHLDPLSTTNVATTAATGSNIVTATRPQAGLRGYLESERARRALSEELRAIRRAAIAEANRPATNAPQR